MMSILPWQRFHRTFRHTHTTNDIPCSCFGLFFKFGLPFIVVVLSAILSGRLANIFHRTSLEDNNEFSFYLHSKTMEEADQ